MISTNNKYSLSTDSPVTMELFYLDAEGFQAHKIGDTEVVSDSGDKLTIFLGVNIHESDGLLVQHSVSAALKVLVNNRAKDSAINIHSDIDATAREIFQYCKDDISERMASNVSK